MKIRVVYCAVALLFACMTHAHAVVIAANDTDSIEAFGTFGNLPDNRLRAYRDHFEFNDVDAQFDGFMKFDFSSIPDDAVITSMTLRTFHEVGNNNPFQDPEVRIYRVSDDSWSRADEMDVHPGLNEALTGVHTGFPSADLVAYDWSLEVGAADWSADLLDDTLSLAMSNVKGSYSYVYWYGSDVSPAPPTLTIEFVPEPSVFALAGSGLIGLAAYRWRRRKP